MNEPQEKNRELPPNDDRLMEALLDAAFPSSSEDQKVEQVIHAIQLESPTPASRTQIPRKSSWFKLAIGPAIAIAALVVISQFFFNSSQRQAYAAVQQSIRSESDSGPREYDVRIINRRPRGNIRDDNVKLFVDRNRFAICTKPLLGRGEVWVGGNENERWIVPRFGPVIVGEEGLLRPWIRSRRVVEVPFLSVSRILYRLQSHYDLELKNPSVKSPDFPVECQHIVATKTREARIGIPDRIDLWTETLEGYAQRIEGTWNRSEDESGWLSLEINLVDRPQLPTNFFEHTAHHDENRKVVFRNDEFEFTENKNQN